MVYRHPKCKRPSQFRLWLVKYLLVNNIFRWFSERAIFSDLEDGYGINHEYLSHEDLYNYTVQKVAEAAPKLKALQNKLNPGGKDIWP